jgi:hypothetical protein
MKELQCNELELSMSRLSNYMQYLRDTGQGSQEKGRPVSITQVRGDSSKHTRFFVGKQWLDTIPWRCKLGFRERIDWVAGLTLVCRRLVWLVTDYLIKIQYIYACSFQVMKMFMLIYL